MSETDSTERARSSVVEHPTFNRVADGSNPSGRATQPDDLDTLLFAMEGELIEADFSQDEDAADRAHRHAITCRGAIDEITTLRAQLEEARAALKLLEAHHVEQNRMKGRDESKSKTLAIIRSTLDAVNKEEKS